MAIVSGWHGGAMYLVDWCGTWIYMNWHGRGWHGGVAAISKHVRLDMHTHVCEHACTQHTTQMHACMLGMHRTYRITCTIIHAQKSKHTYTHSLTHALTPSQCHSPASASSAATACRYLSSQSRRSLGFTSAPFSSVSRPTRATI